MTSITIEQAKALKQLDNYPLSFLGSPQPLGRGICGDNIILFVDDDGVSKKVTFHDGGFVKIPL